MKKLSIIVPVYNMAADGKLAFCLDSLMNQTIEDYEVIAVNDASTDHSLEVLREYEARFPGKLRVVTYPDNRRQGGAKNAGLKAAEGEWIGFVDSDDWVSPDCYEKLLRRGAETGADLVGCDYSHVSRHDFTVGRIVPNNTADQTGVLDFKKREKLILRCGSMVVKIYKASVIRENHLDFPEKIFYEDNCAGAVWNLYFKHFERVDEPLYYYYQHQSSTVHVVSEAKCRDRMRAGELLCEEFAKRGFAEVYRESLEYRFTELYYINTLFSYLQGAKHPKLSFVRELYQGLAERFPEFEKNAYYQEFTGAQEKKWIALQGKSSVRFFCSYLLKSKVWQLKRARKRQ